MENVEKYINLSMMDTKSVVEGMLDNIELVDTISNVVNCCIFALNNKKKIILAGNGGSAADCQHIAGEFVSRFMFDRPGLPAVALTTDTSILTAIGNDYGYEQIFSRQIQSIGNSKDILFAYSTSGKSENIINGLQQAKSQDIITIGLTGTMNNSSKMSEYCDHLIRIPSVSTPKIQEGHLIVGHIICGAVEESLFGT